MKETQLYQMEVAKVEIYPLPFHLVQWIDILEPKNRLYCNLQELLYNSSKERVQMHEVILQFQWFKISS
jgi:hypothetical protein